MTPNPPAFAELGMDENISTLIIGLAGIASTLIVSGIGLYYTAKSRSAPLREALFARQIEIIVQIVHFQARIRVLLTILADRDSTFQAQARDDLTDYFRRFCEVEEQAAAILPVDLWVEVRSLSAEISEAIGECDTGAVRPDRLKILIARMAKVALVSRVLVGTDELTDQSLALFSSQKHLRRVVDLELANFEEIYTSANELSSKGAE